jgi:hypothetical protein
LWQNWRRNKADMCEEGKNTKAMISLEHRSRLQSNQTDTRDVSEESVMSLEPDRERSGSLGNVSGSVGVAEVAEVAEVEQGEKEDEGKTQQGTSRYPDN